MSLLRIEGDASKPQSINVYLGDDKLRRVMSVEIGISRDGIKIVAVDGSDGEMARIHNEADGIIVNLTNAAVRVEPTEWQEP